MKEGTANSFAEASRDAQFDISFDEEADARRARSVIRWDRKKKKYVRQPAGGSTGPDGSSSGGGGGKKIRTESGALIPASYKTDAFAEWKRKNRVRDVRVGLDERDIPLVKGSEGRRGFKRCAKTIININIL